MTVGVGAYALHVWPQFENESVDLRFSLRGTSRPPADVTVVAIDEKTFSDLRQQWPFPRSLHAAMIERLDADGASTIVYDVQFTEPSRLGPRDDLALYEAIGRAGDEAARDRNDARRALAPTAATPISGAFTPSPPPAISRQTPTA